MIHIIAKCPFCRPQEKLEVAIDGSKIVFNPDRADNQECEHLVWIAVWIRTASNPFQSWSDTECWNHQLWGDAIFDNEALDEYQCDFQHDAVDPKYIPTARFENEFFEIEELTEDPSGPQNNREYASYSANGCVLFAEDVAQFIKQAKANASVPWERRTS